MTTIGNLFAVRLNTGWGRVMNSSAFGWHYWRNGYPICGRPLPSTSIRFYSAPIGPACRNCLSAQEREKKDARA